MVFKTIDRSEAGIEIDGLRVCVCAFWGTEGEKEDLGDDGSLRQT